MRKKKLDMLEEERRVLTKEKDREENKMKEMEAKIAKNKEGRETYLAALKVEH